MNPQGEERIVNMQDRASRATQVSAAAGLALALAACGGGGGGSEPAAAGPAFTIERTSVSVSIEEGDDTPAPVSIAGSITGVNEPVFLFVDYTNRGVAFASVSLTGTTTGRLDLRLRPWEELTPGTSTDTVTLRACFDSACTRQVAGSPTAVNVRYTLRPAPTVPTLNLSARGLALASTPGAARLSGAVRAVDSSAGLSNWSATSGAAWLTVTASGRSGDAVRVDARPEGLAPGQYSTVVTVRSDNPQIAEAASFRVGLYVAASAAGSALADAPTLAVPNHDRQRREPVVDPIRPLLYEMRNQEVIAHHLYTGQVAARWPLGGGTVLGLAVADDGRELFALLQGGEVAVIDLDGGAVARRLSVAGFDRLLSNFADGRLTQARVDGRAVLLFNSAGMAPAEIGVLPVLDPLSGARLGGLRSLAAELTGRALVPSEDRRFVYAQTVVNGTDPGFAQLRLQRNSSGRYFGRVAQVSRPDAVEFRSLAAVPGGGVQWGLARFDSNADGLTASSSPLEAFFANRNFPLTFSTRMAYGGDGRLTLVERPFLGGGGATLYLFAADGSLILQQPDSGSGSFSFFNENEGLVLAVSSDGLRAQSNGRLIDLP